MDPIDPLWIYVAVPTVLVSILILIRLKQEKMNRKVDNEFAAEASGMEVCEREPAKKQAVEAKERQLEPRFREEKQETAKKGMQECPHYLGYLYMKRGHESTYIPSECYGCRKLLQCLYSPNVIEKVYGE